MISLLLLLIPLAVQSDAPDDGDTGPARGPEPEVLAHLERWTRRFRRDAGNPGENEQELRAILSDLDDALVDEAAWRRDLFAATLDLLGLYLSFQPDPNALPEEVRPLPAGAARVGRAVERVLDRNTDAELRRFMAREILTLPRLHPAERRLAAVHRLGALRDPTYVMPLVVTARGTDPAVRRAALDALVGWNDESVHNFFIDALNAVQLGALDPDAALYERHFRESGTLGPGRAAARVLRYVKRGLAAGDWREAARAVAVAPVLEDSVAVPALIEALETWVRREAQGHRAKRVQWDVARELERRSGRSIGIHPDRWRRWWEAVRAGEIEPTKQVGGDAAGYSKAGFFGLRPMSDRVTFVIDRSGSMLTAFGAADRSSVGEDPRPSRYEKAVEQMMNFLRTGGEGTRFNIVLFEDGTDMWRRKLVPATEGHLRAARSWLLARRPDGGTQLRHGVERAMMLAPGGRAVDLERLEADTIIVLCDGETAEGHAWVRPLLARTNHVARLLFHGVQIGGRGDGTLERLAEETGGQFVAVD